MRLWTRRLLSGVLLLILLILATATFYCSLRTEETFRQEVARLNRQVPGLLQIEIDEYQRELLVSKVRTSIRYRDYAPLLIDHRIRHFPWGARLYSYLPARLLGDRPDPEELVLQSDIDYSGKASLQMEIPALRAGGEAGRLQIKKGLVECSFAGGMSRGECLVSLAEVALKTHNELSGKVSGVRVHSRFAQQQGLSVGSAELRVEEMDLRLPGATPVVLRNLQHQASSSVESGQVVSDLGLSFAEFALADERFQQGELRLQIQGPGAEVMREIQQVMRQQQQDMAKQQVDPLVMQMQLLGLYQQMFADGVELRLERLALQADSGQLAGQGWLKLRKFNLGGRGIDTFEQMDGEFQLEIDREVFSAAYRLSDRLRHAGQPSANKAVLNELADQLAGGLWQKGFLTRREGGYRLQLSLEEGAGQLNGKPFRF